MLTHAWRWFLYGDTQIFRVIFLVVNIVLLMVSFAVLNPAWHQYSRVRDKWFEAKLTFDYQSNLLKQDNFPSIADPIAIPWKTLAQEYHLLVKSQGKQFYFAGTTDQIIKLLLHVLRHHGQTFSFHIQKNHYKTLLVVVDGNRPER